jgi:hypothetical protein
MQELFSMSTSLHHSDTASPSLTASGAHIVTIARWKYRVLWLLLGITVLSSLTLGRYVQRLRDHRQTSRRMAVNVFWFHLRDMAHDLENAQGALDRGNITQAAEFLRMAYQTSAVAERSATTYASILVEDDSQRSFRLGQAVEGYGFMAQHIASRITNNQYVSPEDESLVTALHADMSLMLTTFSEDLLQNGSYTAIAQGLTQFCQQMQVADIKKDWRISGMDAASKEACRPPR